VSVLWHFVSVLSGTQTVGANVGVRSPKASELLWESKWNSSERERERTALKARQMVAVQSPPLGGARVGLFIGEVKVHITMH
jgi:hypothetical protein